MMEDTVSRMEDTGGGWGTQGQDGGHRGRMGDTEGRMEDTGGGWRTQRDDGGHSGRMEDTGEDGGPNREGGVEKRHRE